MCRCRHVRDIYLMSNSKELRIESRLAMLITEMQLSDKFTHNTGRQTSDARTVDF